MLIVIPQYVSTFLRRVIIITHNSKIIPYTIHKPLVVAIVQCKEGVVAEGTEEEEAAGGAESESARVATSVAAGGG